VYMRQYLEICFSFINVSRHPSVRAHETTTYAPDETRTDCVQNMGQTNHCAKVFGEECF
jgi:hypothetical protein